MVRTFFCSYRDPMCLLMECKKPSHNYDIKHSIVLHQHIFFKIIYIKLVFCWVGHVHSTTLGWFFLNYCTFQLKRRLREKHWLVTQPWWQKLYCHWFMMFLTDIVIEFHFRENLVTRLSNVINVATIAKKYHYSLLHGGFVST
jgi:hypothetical protein